MLATLAIARVSVVENSSALLNADLADIKVRLNECENNIIAADCILYNVPSDVDAEQLVERVCNKLSYDKLKVKEVFRVRPKNVSKNNIKCLPIICKLNTSHDRIKLFKALALFRKDAKRQLCSSDLELSGNFNISIYECLTPTCRQIMSAAIKLKNNKRIQSVFSLRGQVFIRVNPSDTAVRINAMSDFLKIVGGEDGAN